MREFVNVAFLLCINLLPSFNKDNMNKLTHAKKKIIIILKFPFQRCIFYNKYILMGDVISKKGNNRLGTIYET